MSDSDWSERALRGERAAWEALIARHDRRVVVGLLARGLPIDRARDVAQEAWARLYERQQRGELTTLKLPGLAMAQAQFLAIDEARRAASAPDRIGVAATVAQEIDRAATVEERLLGRQQLERARRELAGCPATAQRVFHLYFEQPELSHRELAERAGLSVQRVRQTLCEVRKRLRDAIDEGEHE